MDDTKKDILGREIHVGAWVSFNPPRYKGLLVGKVVGFTPKMVRVEYTLAYCKEALKATSYDNDLTLLPEDAMTFYLLKKTK